MWSDLRLWLRRWWARLRWRQWTYDGLTAVQWERRVAQEWRQRRERGNVALYCGKRWGRFNPTN